MSQDPMTDHRHHVAKLGYRPDIDGLRAMAILPVVFYHAGIPFFGGGFVGVDVFFVISGYLITSFIIGEIDCGEFLIGNFYLRRIRRIFPALFLVMAFCAAVGWLWLTPQDYKLLGQSILATTIFSSNILFSRQFGYFDAPLEERPLLHTWSLGVEEQFYVAFPVFLILVCRFFPRWRVAIMLLICILSFTFNVVTVQTHPKDAFFLLPPRMWELLIGTLLAMEALSPPLNAKWGEAAGILGLALIGTAIFVFSKNTTFPGFAALPPTIGAAALIWGGTGEQGGVTRLLSNRTPVFIGTISYSLYLWHFPLLAFGAYIATAGLSFTARTGLVAFSVVLSIASYIYIEQPVRQGRWIFGDRKFVFSAAASVLALFAGFGLATHVDEGFPGRIGKPGLEALAGANDFDPDREQCSTKGPEDVALGLPLCKIGTDSAEPQFALWGDSHAESLRSAVNDAAERAQRTGVFLGRYGCVPALGIERLDESQCGAVNDAIVGYLVSQPSIQTVILAGRWGLWAEGSRYKHEGGNPVSIVGSPGAPPDNHAALAAGLEKAVAALTVAGKEVWLVGPIPEVGYNVPRVLYLDLLGMPGGVEIQPTYEEFVSRQRFVMALFDKMTKRYPVHVVWPHEGLCNARFCRVQDHGHPLYIDSHHLSRSGARSILAILDPIFGNVQHRRHGDAR
jgi:peptidoglycan/LPS O-acetylase OafA/YrhL